MGRVGIASVLLLALVSGTRAEITADEARSLATGILSVDFSQSPCDVVEGIPGPSYEFGASHDGVAWRAMVSSWNGKVSYDRTCCTVASRQGNGNVSPEQAEAVALAEAQRLLGSDIAQRLEWMPIDTTLGDTYHMESVTKRVGEPPRSGTVPWCAVSVCRYCGAVVAFSQRVPSMLDLVAPAVTADEAVRIAGRSPDVPPGSHPCVPSLEQNARYPGSLDWHIRFVRPGEAVGQTRGRDGRILTEIGPDTCHDFSVDGLSGEIVSSAAVAMDGAWEGRPYDGAHPRVESAPAPAQAAAPPPEHCAWVENQASRLALDSRHRRSPRSGPRRRGPHRPAEATGGVARTGPRAHARGSECPPLAAGGLRGGE